MIHTMNLTSEKYPKNLMLFFTHLLKRKIHSISERTQLHVESFSHDMVHSLSHSKIFTLKEVLLGCAIPTDSKKTVDILSRLKDSCTINIVQEIETSQAELAQEFANGLFPLPLVPKDESS